MRSHATDARIRHEGPKTILNQLSSRMKSSEPDKLITTKFQQQNKVSRLVLTLLSPEDVQHKQLSFCKLEICSN